MSVKQYKDQSIINENSNKTSDGALINCGGLQSKTPFLIEDILCQTNTNTDNNDLIKIQNNTNKLIKHQQKVNNNKNCVNIETTNNIENNKDFNLKQQTTFHLSNNNNNNSNNNNNKKNYKYKLIN